MKIKILLLMLFLNISISHAQYTKESITTLITNDSTKAWIDKSSNTIYTFNKDMKGDIKTGSSVPRPVDWNLSTTDKLNWFLSIGKITYELIISYNKEGTKYLKLIEYTGGNRVAGYKEIKLFPHK